MPIIKMVLETKIRASVDLVFDLARSIDLHMESAIGTNEVAVSGRTKGLIELGETTTWRAKHLGFYQTLTVKITEYKRPEMFVDVMLKGAFKSMKHIHCFEQDGESTIMIDVFDIETFLANFLVEKST